MNKRSRRFRPRYSKIESIVDHLLKLHEVSDPPVPIERIVSGYQIELRKGKLGDVSGMIVRKGDSVIIGVNAEQNPTRQRFTIAHEFGHFLLHEGHSNHLDRNYQVMYRSEKSSLAEDVEEIEANFFAASILMPKSLLDLSGAVKTFDSDETVRDLAYRFSVSRHAMSLRLARVYERITPF